MIWNVRSQNSEKCPEHILYRTQLSKAVGQTLRNWTGKLLAVYVRTLFDRSDSLLRV